MQGLFKLARPRHSKARNNGTTDDGCQSRESRSRLQWLVLKGALTSDAANGYTDNAIIRRDIPKADQRTDLLEWAMERVAANRSSSAPSWARLPQKSTSLKLSSLDDATNKHFKQLVADFAGVPYEREVRNAREAAAELATHELKKRATMRKRKSGEEGEDNYRKGGENWGEREREGEKDSGLWGEGKDTDEKWGELELLIHHHHAGLIRSNTTHHKPPREGEARGEGASRGGGVAHTGTGTKTKKSR